MPTERQIESAIIQYINQIPNSFAWKVPDQRAYRNGVYRKDTLMPAGQPDVTAIVDGVVIFLEVKTAVGKLSEKQKAFHSRIMQCGGVVHVVRSVREVKDLLRGL